MRLFFLVFFIIPSMFVFAQFDTNYVHKTKNQFMVYPLLESANTTMYYDYVNADNSETSLTYTSRDFNSLGFGVSFYRLGFSLSFELPATNIPELKNHKAFNFKGGYSYRKLYGEIKIRNYNGVEEHIVNSDSNYSSTKIRLDIKMRQYGAQVYYFFAKKYNYDANFKNYNIQKKSAVSPYLNIGTNYYYTTGDYLLTDSSENFAFITKFQNYSLRVMPGFSFSIVHKHLYLAAMGGIGAALNRNTVHLALNSVKYWSVSPIYEFNAAVGYSTTSWFVTLVLSVEFDNVNYGTEHLAARNNLLSFKVGKRFNSKYLGKVGKYL